MATLPRGPLVEVGGHTISYEDVVLAAVTDGSWEALVGRCAEGMNGDREGAADTGDVRRAAESFRRRRRLEAGEDLRSWLAARAITLAQWESHLRRTVVLDQTTSVPSRPPRMPAEFGDALRTDSFCSGFWDNGARRVLSWWAAAELDGEVAAAAADIDRFVALAVGDETTELGAIGGDGCRTRLATLMAWRGAHERLGEHIVDEPTLAGFVAERWLDWSVITVESCLFSSESAAREALLCATEDGLRPEEIADRARGSVDCRTVRAGQLGDGLATRMLSAPLHSPFGPVRDGARWSVVWVRHREPPDPTDPVVRRDAEAELVAAAVHRQLIGREVWRAPR